MRTNTTSTTTPGRCWKRGDTTSENTGPESLQPQYQYVWSPRYIDAPVLRDENTDADGLCDDGRIYYLGDANFNVTALVDTAGDALERYLYSPYGVPMIHDASWANIRSDSSYANGYTYTGRQWDRETGLYYYRHRMYHAQLGRFASRDPIGYEGSDPNLFRYCDGSPTVFVDTTGLITTRDGSKRCWSRPKLHELQFITSRGEFQYANMLSLNISNEIGSSFFCSWGPFGGRTDSFIKDGCECCTKIGFVQIAKSRVNEGRGYWGWVNTFDWRLDGAIPYPYSTTANPTLPPGNITLRDTPGMRILTRRFRISHRVIGWNSRSKPVRFASKGERRHSW